VRCHYAFIQRHYAVNRHFGGFLATLTSVFLPTTIGYLMIMALIFLLLIPGSFTPPDTMAARN
jgi:hypothetical protein